MSQRNPEGAVAAIIPLLLVRTYKPWNVTRNVDVITYVRMILLLFGFLDGLNCSNQLAKDFMLLFTLSGSAI